MDTPASLLERLRRPAEQQAWARFVDLYTPLLYYWARRTGCPEADAADLTQDQQSKSSYYTIRVNLTADELHRLGKLQLVSGMPAELFLQAGSRTMMSYLLKPITDQLKRTFSEP